MFLFLNQSLHGPSTLDGLGIEKINRNKNILNLKILMKDEIYDTEYFPQPNNVTL